MNYGTIKLATNHQHSHSSFVGFSGCIRQGSLAGRKGRQRHHQGTVPPGGENLPDHTQPCGTSYPPRHRSSLGQRWPGYAAKIFRLYRQQYQGKTHEFGIYCAYCRQAPASVEVFGSSKFLKQNSTAVDKGATQKSGSPSSGAIWENHINIIGLCQEKTHEFRIYRPHRR